MVKRIGVMITAPRLFLVAREAYEQLISAHSRPKGVSVGLTAIVFAAVSLEALINEVTELAALEIAEQENSDPELLSFVEVIDEIERSRGSTRLKFLLASSVLGGETYEKGSNPYQDYALLTSLRDALVHLKPTKLMAEEGKTRIGVEGVFKESATDPRRCGGRPFPSSETPGASVPGFLGEAS